MPTRKGSNNQTTVPILDQNGTPLAPARPSRVRRWLESGRATKVRVKGIFAVQLHNVDATNAVTQPMVLNLDPGRTSGIAITRESNDGLTRAVVGTYEHQHRNREIKKSLSDRRKERRNRRGRLRSRPARFNNRANAREEGRLPPSLRNTVEDYDHITDTMQKLCRCKKG